MAKKVLSASGLKLSYQQKSIIENLDIAFIEKKITVIIGPNGCGKSTLLKGLGRILAHDSGEIFLNQRNLAELSTKEIAQQLAFLPQGATSPEDVTVHDVVSIGRYPYQGILQKKTNQDEQIIDEVLRETGLLALADENVQYLSGGQKQRVWIAMALAQKTPIILLDEPTTYLDLGHQLEILNLLKRLNKEKDLTVIMVLHDLNLAARFSDWMIGMKNGAICYQGTAREVMTELVLKDLFNINAYLGVDPVDGSPICLRFE
ncbi:MULTISPECIES: ABC transporter ATP-binding protein [unclassified Enterococcus]|uniref:ABC transporter ATP-binding protein n=1 Tax=unclassified Enterococcus TaxID=2608891 RepID=UPI00155211B8|nr:MULTISPECIES: ABC transporter ATP-binding protein [unclassified Enterococcus]MBS7576754.1 ABC transporter ATP-binding protein [Enterococcus sp. MMGLQ5-2]MBS7583759.1 ABC transporter ATP-binding protein [Enterococcus sp. MMGLQ5-1]NPD11620.1 ABC transporter ATP-binding protein [Enterococcus sp. MMGLQ5-1]NPD36591.1 ABC transporter ATP-binding protein [Enterococcus sp. MMGLQ5-2]